MPATHSFFSAKPTEPNEWRAAVTLGGGGAVGMLLDVAPVKTAGKQRSCLPSAYGLLFGSYQSAQVRLGFLYGLACMV